MNPIPEEDENSFITEESIRIEKKLSKNIEDNKDSYPNNNNENSLIQSENNDNKSNITEEINNNINININQKKNHLNNNKKNIKKVIKKVEYKIILLGEFNVGKSSIIAQFVDNNYQKIEKQKNCKNKCKSIAVDSETVAKLELYDSSGEEKFNKTLPNQFYKDAYGAIIVYDITNKESFKNVDKWINDLKESGDDDVSILIVGNKCDLEASREVTTDEVKKKAELYKMAYCETSALKGENIDNAFRTLIKIVVEKNEKKKNEEDKYGNKSNVISTGVTLETKIISEEKRPKNKYGKCC